MSSASTLHAHIAYELIGETQPKVLVVEFLSHTIADPAHAAELSEQLASLIRPDLPSDFVLDFKKVRSLGSHAFTALESFAHNVREARGRVAVCNMDEFVRFGADMSGLADDAEFATDRQSAINSFGDGEPAWTTEREERS
jgi:anti-anti-sigma factor